MKFEHMKELIFQVIFIHSFRFLFVKIKLKYLQYWNTCWSVVSSKHQQSQWHLSRNRDFCKFCYSRFRGTEESFQVETDVPSEVVRVELRWATVQE